MSLVWSEGPDNVPLSTLTPETILYTPQFDESFPVAYDRDASGQPPVASRPGQCTWHHMPSEDDCFPIGLMANGPGFMTKVRLADTAPRDAAAVFRIMVDGRQKFEKTVVATSDQPVSAVIDLENARTLGLLVDYGPDGSAFGARAVWAMPMLVRQKGSPPSRDPEDGHAPGRTASPRGCTCRESPFEMKNVTTVLAAFLLLTGAADAGAEPVECKMGMDGTDEQPLRIAVRFRATGDMAPASVRLAWARGATVTVRPANNAGIVPVLTWSDGEEAHTSISRYQLSPSGLPNTVRFVVQTGTIDVSVSRDALSFRHIGTLLRPGTGYAAPPALLTVEHADVATDIHQRSPLTLPGRRLARIHEAARLGRVRGHCGPTHGVGPLQLFEPRGTPNSDDQVAEGFKPGALATGRQEPGGSGPRSHFRRRNVADRDWQHAAQVRRPPRLLGSRGNGHSGGRAVRHRDVLQFQSAWTGVSSTGAA